MVDAQHRGERRPVLADRDDVGIQRVQRRLEQPPREDRGAEIADALRIDPVMSVQAAADVHLELEAERTADLGPLFARDPLQDRLVVGGQIPGEIEIDPLAPLPALRQHPAAKLDAPAAEPLRQRPGCFGQRLRARTHDAAADSEARGD